MLNYSAPDPAREAYGALPDPLAVFNGPTAKGRREEMGDRHCRTHISQWQIQGGEAAPPFGVLQKNSGSTNFENSEDSRQHDYYYYQFLPCS